MKRWMLMTVVVVSALALMATPALAADQTRSQDRLQDGTCADCTAECDETQMQARDCDGTQTQAGDQTQTQVKVGTATQTQVKAQVGAATQTQVKAQVGAATQTQTMLQSGDQEQSHTPEWVRKLARFQKQYAKRVHAITSSD